MRLKKRARSSLSNSTRSAPSTSPSTPRRTCPPGSSTWHTRTKRSSLRNKSPRKKSLVIDVPGVLVSFADPKSDAVGSAQCVELSSGGEGGPKQFVYFWERDNVHRLLDKLRGKYEIIVWSSLGPALTDLIVAHIERDKSYFALVLSKAQCLSFDNRKPTNLVMAQATLSVGKKGDQKKALEMSFSSINKSLYPGGLLKDMSMLLKNRSRDSIIVMDCTDNAL